MVLITFGEICHFIRNELSLEDFGNHRSISVCNGKNLIKFWYLPYNPGILKTWWGPVLMSLYVPAALRLDSACFSAGTLLLCKFLCSARNPASFYALLGTPESCFLLCSELCLLLCSEPCFFACFYEKLWTLLSLLFCSFTVFLHFYFRKSKIKPRLKENT